MQELRERQAKEREYAEIQDFVSGATFSSDEDHTYAGIGSFDSSVDDGSLDPYSTHHYHLPQTPPSPPAPHSSSSSPPLEPLYAQVNKPRNGRPAPVDR